MQDDWCSRRFGAVHGATTIEFNEADKVLFGYGTDWSRPRTPTALPRREMVRGTASSLPSLETVMTVDNALAAYEYVKATGGQAAGIDRIRYSDISRAEVAAAFRVLLPLVLAGAYRPQPPRVVEIAKNGGGTRELRLQVILDRIVARMLYEAMYAYVDALFVPWSFGFRPRKSTWDLLGNIKINAETYSLYVITADDIRKAFDNIPVERLLRLLGDVITDHQFWSAVAAMVRGSDNTNETEVGIAQGNALSPTMLNLYLHKHLDTLLDKETSLPSRNYRYADNLVSQTRDAREGERLLECTRGLLLQAGMSLKGDPGKPIDIRSEPVDLLGFTLSARSDRVHLGIQQKSWDKLNTKLQDAHLSPNPPVRVQEIVLGWCSAVGPALENRIESCERHITRSLCHAGFRGVISKDALRAWMTESRESWMRILHRIKHPPSPVMS